MEQDQSFFLNCMFLQKTPSSISSLLNLLCVCVCVSFFVVEDHILHVTQGLITRAYTDELWNMALSKIIAVLRTHSVSGPGFCAYVHLVHLLKEPLCVF